MPGNSRICGSLGVARDRQSKSGQHGWIHCGVLRVGDRIGRRSGESLIEVQFDTGMPRACKQRVGETLLRVILEQGRGQP
jgi:hypothetical protein